MWVAKNKGLDHDLFEAIITLNKECAFHKLMDIQIVELGEGVALLETPISKKHINPQDVAHGGVAFSLADTAMGIAIRTLNNLGATIEMNMNYLRPVTLGETLTATGKVLELGSKIIVVEGEVINEHKERIALARGTFYNKGLFIL